LFAVGEVSGGVHGADRPGGDNLTDSQVFGYRGGRAAATFALERVWKLKDIRPIQLVLQGTTQNLNRVQEALDNALMIVRRKEELLELLEAIRDLRRRVSVLSTADDNFLLNAEIFGRAALLREESRGTHYREDHPKTEPNCGRPSILCKGKNGEMEAFLMN
jgi:fumarate reductase (CoM/CoB) subunit A